MKPILEEGIGEESSQALKEANSRWSKEIAPIQRNKIYNKIKYEGKLPSNIMKELRGTGVGMQELKDIIKGDQELLRNVVGQKFANAPHKLHEIGDLEKEYVNQMPELKQMLAEHKGLSGKISETEKVLPQIEKTAQKLTRRQELQESIDKMDARISDLKQKASRKDIL
jgi:vacuolar-type H+-ATPase subunit I/STV1